MVQKSSLKLVDQSVLALAFSFYPLLSFFYSWLKRKKVGNWMKRNINNQQSRLGRIIVRKEREDFMEHGWL